MGRKKQNLKPFLLRLNPKTLEKLEWLALERGLNKTETARYILEAAVRMAKPPESAKSREILVSEEEWADWEKLMHKMNTSIESVMRKVMTTLLKKSGSDSSAES